MSSSQEMAFKRFGRSYHLKIETADELVRVLDLNEAHWVATGAPIETIGCDATFLDLVDVDDNGRILCFELHRAIRWLFDVLKDTGAVTEHVQQLNVNTLNTENTDGMNIAESARKMLRQLGRDESEAITLDEVRSFKQEVEETPVSEAGVVLAEATEDVKVKAFITDVVSTLGGTAHPSGELGVTRELLDAFLAEVQTCLDWRAHGELPSDQTRTDIMPLGTETTDAYAACVRLADKIDQYFAQCRAVALDGRLAQRLSPTPEELVELELSEPAAIDEVLKLAPLAKPTPSRTLPLDGADNPYYAEGLDELRTKVVEPILDKTTAALTEADWEKVTSVLAEHRTWLESRPNEAIETLEADKLHGYLDGTFRSAVEELIDRSVKTAFVLDNIRLTEKLILYQAHLTALANNFVSFPDLYDEKRRAMFEMGTLICDGRRFNMAIRVKDRARHSKVARNSQMYVLYVEVSTQQGQMLYTVAVPVTSGGKGNLCVGKRGVFQDVHDNEFDAVVVEVIENPISLLEALVSPFQRIGRALTGKIESLTAQAEKKLDSSVVAAAPANRPVGLAAGGLLMGGGVALAALGSALAYVTKTLDSLDNWYLVLYAVGAVVLAVLVPVTVVALMKLRRRDLSAILEGSGWAINARMRLSRQQSRFFTQRPHYPADAKGTPRRRWWILVLALLALGALVLALRTHWSKPSETNKTTIEAPAGTVEQPSETN